MKIFYICNGNKDGCGKQSCAYYSSYGECTHTLDESCALNKPEDRRFKLLENGDLWEVDE